MSPGGRVEIGTPARRYLSGTFAELCRIESPSGSERACGERVMAELRALGIETLEDDAGRLTGSDCGNLLARLPAAAATDAGGGPPAVMFCAHLDTVPPQAPVEPVLSEGVWENANEGILGADNKAAVVVLLALARTLHAEGSPVELELLFTVGEERSLAGASVFDVDRLNSHVGFVFDHASEIGEVIERSPSHFRLEAHFRGASAHAGIRPEDGRSAIVGACRAIAALPVGRVDEQTTINVASISGGGAINVVPDACSFTGEVRSLDQERAERLVGQAVERIHDAAHLPDCDVDVDVSVEQTFAGYRQPPGGRAIAVAEAALRQCGREPRRIASGGGSDINALIAAGLDCVNLANGTRRPHEPGESVADEALAEMLEVALALVEQSASLEPSNSR
ncbi:MAG TPA: M20/M25/M40 family metallo-hydrolase [Solirubrobacteraceae bacterium]|nr:M20/M25/M40 family metallo-hydrolase [Solirubrobacteraceae bacterium]